MSKSGRLLAIFGALVCLVLYATSVYAYYPPDFSQMFSYHGDADGDEYVIPGDMPSHETQANVGLCLDYNTMQSNNDDDRWNTCDVDGDTYCTVMDLPMLYTVTSGGIVDASPFFNWAVDFYNQQASYPKNQWNPFQLNVTSDMGLGPNGRAGFIVQVTITGGTAPGAQLLGRNCSPDFWGAPDQDNTTARQDTGLVDPLCAVGVSQTHWMVDPTLGLTENAGSPDNNPYGLQFQATGGGTIELHAAINSNDSFLIPAFSNDFTVTIPAGDAIDIDCTTPGPNPVNELSAMQCTITATSQPQIDTGTDTCGGSISGSGPTTWYYDLTPTEAQGPGACTAGVQLVSNTAIADSDGVTINEVNQNPTWATTPTNVNINAQQAYSATDGVVTDADLPNAAAGNPGYIASCTRTVIGSCSFTTTYAVSGGAGAPPKNCNLSFTSGVGDEVCTLRLSASDGWTPAGTVGTTVTVTVTNQPPVNNAPATQSGNELTSISFGTAPTDPEAPPEVLTSSIVSYTGACNGSFAGNTWSFTPTEAQGPGTCSVLTRVSDGNKTNDERTTITINEVNQNPTWSTTPTNVTINAQQAYSATDGVVTDADLPNAAAGNPGYIASCTRTVIGSCSFTTTYAVSGGAGAPPKNCNLSFTSGVGDEVCTLRLSASDGWTPAGTVGTTVTVTVTNQPPVNNAPATQSGNELTSISFGTAPTDPEAPPEVLTSSIVSYTGACNGSFAGNTWSFTPTEAQGPGTCSVLTRVSDGNKTNDKRTTITINEVNQNPVWATQPSSPIAATNGTPYSDGAGSVTDADLPNTGGSDPGHVTCQLKSTGNTCTGFTVTIGGSGNGAAHCTRSFTPNCTSGSSCQFVEQVVDGYSATVDSNTVTVNIADCGITWDATSPNAATSGVGGVDGPVVARVANNYPADWKQITLDFSGNITAVTASSVECAAPRSTTYAAQAGAWSYTSDRATFTLTGTNWPSENNCRVHRLVTNPACSNCSGPDKIVTFHASKRTTECAATGGGCGGFIDDGTYGSNGGNTAVVVTVVKKEDFSTLTSLGDGIYTYLLFEQDYNLSPSTVTRQEFFDGNNDGAIEIAAPNKSAPAKITVGYHGYQGNCWKDKPPASGMVTRDCFQLTTIIDMDSRRLIFPLDYTSTEAANLNRVYISGTIPISSFQTMVQTNPPGSGSGYNGFPNPIRLGFASLTYRNQSLSDLSIATIFQPDTGDQTIMLCYGNGGNKTLKVKSALPFNVLIPDLIRASASGGCSGGYGQGPGTSYRYYTNEKGITRTMMIIGGVADSQLYNTDKGLNISIFPIFLKAFGTYSATIPATYTHLSSVALGSTPFELDMRDPGFAAGAYDGGHASGSGRSILATLPRVLATDQVRVAMGTTPCRYTGSACATYPTLPYGDPNRWEQANWSTGGTVTKNGTLLALGGRLPGSGSDPGGIIVSQLHMTSRVDSEQFTFFKRAHNASGHPKRPAFSNDNPWSGSSTKTGVVSEWMTGIPSTRTDPGYQVLWTQVEDAISITMNRPQVESYIEGGMATALDVVGNMQHSQVINDITPPRSVKATTEWVTQGNVTSPTHDGWYIPNQTGLRGYGMTVDIPINRDGHIWRGTAGYRNGVVSAGADQIQKKTGGMQYFTISNPTLNVDATRRPDYFVFFMADGRGRIDPRADDKEKDGYMNWRTVYNRYWKFYGNLQGKSGSATYQFTVPYILVGSRTLGTVLSAVPRPFQGNGSSMTNSTVLEWDLLDLIIGTKAAGGGVTAVFDYQNQNFNWFNIGAEFSSVERFQYIWQL